jgi:deoxyhypusine synthase
MPKPSLSGPRIQPPALTGKESLTDLIDRVFTAYNSARLREAAQLLRHEILKEDVTVGLSLSGALTPPGFATSCLVPLIEAGFIDWIISTGANLYHDTHHALGHSIHSGSPWANDVELREQGAIRIYDIVFDQDVLFETDAFYRRVFGHPEFNCTLSSPELHYRVGRYVAELETRRGAEGVSLLGAAYRHAVPIFVSSPGDSSIGMNAAALAIDGQGPLVDVNKDVNLSAAIVYDAKKSGGRTACWIMGGGSPKNFLLQTEPHLHEVLGIPEAGHDFFMQFTDARPDTGGLSGATPSEAVSWGKIDPDQLPSTVVAYVDSTIALPLLTHYVLANVKPRQPRRLCERLDELYARLVAGRGTLGPAEESE